MRVLYRALFEQRHARALLRVGVWCIGEYGDLLVNNRDFLEDEAHLSVSPAEVSMGVRRGSAGGLEEETYHRGERKWV